MPRPSSVAFAHVHNSYYYGPELISLNGSHTSSVDFVTCKIAWLTFRITFVSMGSKTFTCRFVHSKQTPLASEITSLYGSQTSPVDLWMQNSVNRSRMMLVYWSQPTSVVLCIQNSAFRTRFTSLYGSQTSPMVFCPLNSDFGHQNWKSLWGPSPHLWFCAFKTATLCITELLVSIESQHFICGFVHAKQRDLRTRDTSLYGSQTAPIVFLYSKQQRD